jgi:hypothetical protein
MSEMREGELQRRLRALATEDAERVPSPAVRAKVMQAWDTRQDALRTPRRFSLRVWLPVAASLTIGVGLMIGSIHQTLESGRTVTAGSALFDHDDVTDTMLTLPDASLLPRFDHGELLRVEIPSPAGPIQAEVLIGQDGLARAIRVIQ